MAHNTKYKIEIDFWATKEQHEAFTEVVREKAQELRAIASVFTDDRGVAFSARATSNLVSTNLTGENDDD